MTRRHCDACGRPIKANNALGVCWGVTQACVALRRTRLAATMTAHPPARRGPRRCKRCLGPLSQDAIYGVCSRNPRCAQLARALAKRRWYWSRYGEPPVCRECGRPIKRSNRVGICTRKSCYGLYQVAWRKLTPRNMETYQRCLRRWQQENPERRRAVARAWYHRNRAARLAAAS